MSRRRFIKSAAALLLLPGSALAQAGKIYRVGLCFQVSPDIAKPLAEGFSEGLRSHGYSVGRNLILDIRYGDGSPARLPALVDELIALKPDVLAGFETAAKIMKEKTSVIPIVITNSSDPVGIGLAQSLARPGGNVTGVSIVWEQLVPKSIELLREILPRVARVGLLLDASSPGSKAAEENARRVAKTYGVSIVPYLVSGQADLEKSLAAMEKDRLDALAVGGGGVIVNYSKLIDENSLRLKIPMAGYAAMGGGLFSYAPNLIQAYRESARYVDRILKGANPASLPIEQPTRFEMVINLKIARALGLTIPQSVLLRADRLIE
jgi:putative ABC transport system substrate-binding protein